jgi:protein involved in temperature-dependent protein secretion
MSIEQSIEKGEFEAALSLLTQATAVPNPDPGQLLTTFNLEARLQRFDAAEAAMRRLLAAAPQVAPVMERYRLAARAEATATARLTDPALAGKRKALGAPPPYALAYVKAAVHHAQKDYAGAAAALAEAKSFTPAISGTLTWANGRTARFTHLTDSDDLTGPNLPCYEGDSLLDVSYTQLRMVRFLECKTSLDVMWMPTELTTAGGKPVNVRVPSYYTGTGKAQMGMVRTGQMTTWERDHGYAQALGQRDFKVTMADGGESMVGMLQVVKIELDVQAGAAAEPEKPKSLWKRIFG